MPPNSSPGQAEEEAFPRVMMVLLVLLSKELLLAPPPGALPTPVPWLSPHPLWCPQTPEAWHRDLTGQTLRRGSDPGSSSFPTRPWLPPGHSRWGWGLDLSASPFLPAHPPPSGAASSLQNAPGTWALPSPWEASLGLRKCVPCYSNLLPGLRPQNLGCGSPRLRAEGLWEPVLPRRF